MTPKSWAEVKDRSLALRAFEGLCWGVEKLTFGIVAD